MEDLIQHIQEIIGLPEYLLNTYNIFPTYIREAFLTSLYFIPILYFLYYAIELVERFFLKNIYLFMRFLRYTGPLFGIIISILPECGFQIIAANFFSRRLITRGTLLAFFITCSDDALPLLFLDMSKVQVILPIIIIKTIVAIIVACIVDLLFIFNNGLTKDLSAMHTDLNETACCHHKLVTSESAPYWWMHPLTHTFNMFMFTFLWLSFINCAIVKFGSAENLANFIGITTPYQVIGAAIIGIIPNCVVSIFLALAFVKNIISLPAFIAGLVTTTGLGLMALAKHEKKNSKSFFITVILLVTGIITGLAMYYYPEMLSQIQTFLN